MDLTYKFFPLSSIFNTNIGLLAKKGRSGDKKIKLSESQRDSNRDVEYKYVPTHLCTQRPWYFSTLIHMTSERCILDFESL